VEKFVLTESGYLEKKTFTGYPVVVEAVDACTIEAAPALLGRFPLQALNRKAHRVNALIITRIKKRGR